MKAWIFSDLHLEFAPLDPDFEVPDADVCVVAGDVCTGGPAKAIRILHDLVPAEMPVIFVAGNHDYYRGFLQEGFAEGCAAPMRSNFYFLENGVARVGDVMFAGATLWTDFNLHGAAASAMRACSAALNDYRSIKYRKKPFSKLQPVVTLRKHIESRRFITEFLETNDRSKTVVVTHHAPSSHSIPEEFYLDIHSAAYASNLDRMISESGPSLWVHGHVHAKLDYKIGQTRLVCNSRGYADEPSFSAFEIAFVVEV